MAIVQFMKRMIYVCVMPYYPLREKIPKDDHAYTKLRRLFMDSRISISFRKNSLMRND